MEIPRKLFGYFSRRLFVHLFPKSSFIYSWRSSFGLFSRKRLGNSSKKLFGNLSGKSCCIDLQSLLGDFKFVYLFLCWSFFESPLKCVCKFIPGVTSEDSKKPLKNLKKLGVLEILQFFFLKILNNLLLGFHLKLIWEFFE